MVPRKVAIISDVIMNIGGAEKVLDTLLEMFPESELYTLLLTNQARKRITRNFPKVKILTSIFQRWIDFDFSLKYLSFVKILSWIYWEFLNLDKFDLVISSSHSYMAKNVKSSNHAFHLSYIHTTPRYLYGEFNEMGFIKIWPWKIVLWPIISLLRMIDKNGSKRSDMLIANSINVAKRIQKYYGQNAKVIYPPVDVKIIKNLKLKITNTINEYYVCLSRLVKQKGIELAVKTCSRNHIKLIVIGNGPELNNLKRLANKNIVFETNCTDREKYIILAKAKALIYPSINEDFGMVPVEALGLGVPIIGYSSGGVRETVIDGKNGVIFNEFSENSLLKAIKRLGKIKINESDCIASAKKFSKKIFIKKIQKIIDDQ